MCLMNGANPAWVARQMGAQVAEDVLRGLRAMDGPGGQGIGEGEDGCGHPAETIQQPAETRNIAVTQCSSWGDVTIAIARVYFV
jgi:hypothetical protein